MKRITCTLLLAAPLFLTGCNTMTDVFDDGSVRRPDYADQEPMYRPQERSSHHSQQHYQKQDRRASSFAPQRQEAAPTTSQSQPKPRSRTEAAAERTVVPATNKSVVPSPSAPAAPSMAPVVQ